MQFKIPVRTVVLGFLSLAALLAAGCSSVSGSLSANPNAQTGQAFVIGTDAPAASVVSFTATLASVDAIDSNGNSVPLISGSPTVDFARFNGLQTLLDVDNVPAGTYNSVSITLGPSVTVGYLDTSTTPPGVKTTTFSVSTSPIKVTLPSPVTLGQATSGGIRLDFNLHQSIQVTNGQISGVNPTFRITSVLPDDASAHIDEFTAGVLSVDATNQQFTIQGPHGRQFTVNVNGQTQWDDNSNLGELTTSTVVQISGKLAKAEATIDADEVAILSQDKFFASGQITYVTPATGDASSFDLYVRSLEPANTGINLGQIATVDLNGSENYYIYWMRNPMTQFLFNSSALVAGQDVAIGGPVSGASNPTAVTTKRVVLRQWGFEGTVVPGSVNSSVGTFKMQVNGFAGVLIPTPITVYIGDATDFRDGVSSVSDVPASVRVRVVGLLLKNPTNGNIVLLARHVDGPDM
ncbi:MAG TPA: DUF4382 domain-containing protein [Terracidiphilus sp.]|nr:DUF4382 domain-containing protein [Terracidiphilus sp.]